MQEELIQHLSQFVTENRFELFNKVVQDRTDYITVVLEDIYQPHNASAVLRSCDCFGIQNVHIIENQNEYKVNPDVALGSSQWLDLHKHNSQEENTVLAINKLKSEGYRIVATTPHTNDVNLEEFDISKGKFALMFGSELPGLTKIAMEHADEFLKIPMYGFTESFNISVSAAISLHHLSHNMRNSEVAWQMSEDRKNEILLKWLKSSIKKSSLIINKFNESK